MTDHADIVDRLRDMSNGLTPAVEAATMREAADKIEELRRELHKMASMFGMCIGREMRRALYEGEG